MYAQCIYHASYQHEIAYEMLRAGHLSAVQCLHVTVTSWAVLDVPKRQLRPLCFPSLPETSGQTFFSFCVPCA